MYEDHISTKLHLHTLFNCTFDLMTKVRLHVVGERKLKYIYVIRAGKVTFKMYFTTDYKTHALKSTL